MVYAVTGGTLSIVQGSYEYHHYLQDGFNDSVIAILLPSNNCNMFLKLCVFYSWPWLKCPSGGYLKFKHKHTLVGICE
jgi:hypothetical protein